MCLMGARNLEVEDGEAADEKTTREKLHIARRPLPAGCTRSPRSSPYAHVIHSENTFRFDRSKEIQTLSR